MLKARLEKHSIPEPNSGCTLWCGATNRRDDGYGVLNIDGRPRYAHRLAWELANGPIPEGMHVCHKCDVKLCINPAHMFLGTHAANMADKVAKERQCRGERRPLSKLTEADVRQIRRLPGTHSALADRFGVNFQTISKIRNYTTWRHV